MDHGVRLFEEAKLAADRRGIRSTRRVKRRKRQRLDDLRELLVRNQIIEKDFRPLNNPYDIRAKGLSEKLSNAELATALLHIAKRRGPDFETIEESDAKLSESQSTKSQLSKNRQRLNELKYVCLVQLERLKETGKIRANDNTFTSSDYKNELSKILEVSNIENNLAQEIIEIILRRRSFEHGPGSLKSPTEYGRFKPVEGDLKDEIYDFLLEDSRFLKDSFIFDYKNKEYFINKSGIIVNNKPYNLVDLMRGKCSLFPNEYRAPKQAPSAMKFNLINDLVNLRISTQGDRRLTKEEINKVLDYLKKELRFTKGVNTLLKILNLEDDIVTGFRIDTKDKEIITDYEFIHSKFKSLELTEQEREVLNNISLLDHIAEILTNTKTVESRIDELSKVVDDNLAEKLANLTGFSMYHSLSFKAINELIPEMIENQANQQEIITRTYRNNDTIKELKFDEESILSPATKRSHRQAINVIKELINKYGNFDSIVIETARESNSKAERDSIRDSQKVNKKRRDDALNLIKERYGDEIESQVNITNTLINKIMHYIEQDSKCIYTGDVIDLYSLIFDPTAYEIDHIIPYSISRDNSYNNKVLVTSFTNQQKVNNTPFMAYKKGLFTSSKINNYELFKDMVNSNKKIHRDKKANLLFEKDINSYTVQQSFIERNLNDTRYASRSILNTLQEYFISNDIKTKVYAVRGKNTSYIRGIGIKRWRNEDVKSPLIKDRNKHIHHAIDALIVAGLSRQEYFNARPHIYKYNDLYREKEVITPISYNIERDSYITKLINELNLINYTDTKVSYKIDQMPNKQFFDQTIYSTRNIDGKDFTLRKIKDIYSLTSKDIEDNIIKNKEKLLMYNQDIKTYDLMVQAYEQYKHEKKPFEAFKINNDGVGIRKYSKKGNGPEIKSLRYVDKGLGEHFDISHKYDVKDGKKVVQLSLNPYRADIYKLENGSYKMAIIRYSDLRQLDNERYIIDEEIYNNILSSVGIDKGDQFQFSIYKNTIIKYYTNDEELTYRAIGFSGNRIEVKGLYENYGRYNSEGNFVMDRVRITIGAKNPKKLEKYNVSIIGQTSKVESEPLQLII